MSNSGSRSLAQSFNPKSNSLNTIRLVLANLVIWGHAYPIGGFPGRPKFGTIDPGGLAVAAFFALSGYLITSSRARSSFKRFLRARFLRIFPGFWVNLIVTAFVFAAVVGSHNNTWHAADAISYVYKNFFLLVKELNIGHTLDGFPYQAWNGSLWTLIHEFLCYILIGLLFSVRHLRTPPVLLGLFFGVTAFNAIQQFRPFHLKGHGLGLVQPFAQLSAFFLAGSILYIFRSRIPMSRTLFIVSVVTVLAAMKTGCFYSVAPIAVAYSSMWLGTVMPPLVERIGDGHIDISYGVYIYAFPIQQLLVFAGMNRYGVHAMIWASVAMTIIPATLSWYLVEKPCLKLKSKKGSRLPTATRTPPSPA